MRILAIALVLAVAACTPEQSKNIGNQPKKTVDSVSGKVNDLMKQQGQDSERLKDADK
jgi:hypothetical protein